VGGFIWTELSRGRMRGECFGPDGRRIGPRVKLSFTEAARVMVASARVSQDLDSALALPGIWREVTAQATGGEALVQVYELAIADLLAERGGT
jgi:hypothetical protein